MFGCQEGRDIRKVVGDERLKAGDGVATNGFPASDDVDCDLVPELLLFRDRLFKQIEDLFGRCGNTESGASRSECWDNVGGETSIDGANVQGGLTKVRVGREFLEKVCVKVPLEL